jgi:hypothetical protein
VISPNDRLQTFLYVLARDHLPTGVIETVLTDFVEKNPELLPVFSSPQLANLAAEWTDRILVEEPNP